MELLGEDHVLYVATSGKRTLIAEIAKKAAGAVNTSSL